MKIKWLRYHSSTKETYQTGTNPRRQFVTLDSNLAETRKRRRKKNYLSRRKCPAWSHSLKHTAHLKPQESFPAVMLQLFYWVGSKDTRIHSVLLDLITHLDRIMPKPKKVTVHDPLSCYFIKVDSISWKRKYWLCLNSESSKTCGFSDFYWFLDKGSWKEPLDYSIKKWPEHHFPEPMCSDDLKQIRRIIQINIQ